MSAAKKSRCLQLVRQGLPYTTIAGRLGIDQSTVSCIATANGIKRDRESVCNWLAQSLKATGDEHKVSRGTRWQRECAEITFGIESKFVPQNVQDQRQAKPVR